MKKLATNVAFVVATLLMIAGAIFWFKDSMGDENTPVVEPTVAPVVLMSTDGVEENIERRLTSRAGRRVTAECPKKVDQAIGTKFTCDVFFPGRDDAISTAHVEIDGRNGQFSWIAEPNETDETDEAA